jgi:uncharacterized protein YukE
MEDAKNKLTQGRDDIYQKLDHLRNHIASLVSTGFVTDRASSAFNEAYDRFNNGARSTIQGLDEVSAFLTRVVSTMREADNHLAGAIK